MLTEKLIQRDILVELHQDLGRDQMAFLIGPRQSGKTSAKVNSRLDQYSTPAEFRRRTHSKGERIPAAGMFSFS